MVETCRTETESFDDGRKTVRSFDAEGHLVCIETFDDSGELKAAIDYLYDAEGINVERIVRDAAGSVLRRMLFDAQGNELNPDDPATVRWASMDGSDSGEDPRGQEKLSQDDG